MAKCENYFDGDEGTISNNNGGSNYVIVAPYSLRQ